MELSTQSKAKLESAVVQAVEILAQAARQAVTGEQQEAKRASRAMTEQDTLKLESAVVQQLVHNLFAVTQVGVKALQQHGVTSVRTPNPRTKARVETTTIRRQPAKKTPKRKSR